MRHLLLALLLTGTLLAASAARPEREQRRGVRANRIKLLEAYDRLTETYYTEVNPTPLVERAVHAMTAGLDPFTRYLTAEETERFHALYKEGEGRSIDTVLLVEPRIAYIRLARFTRTASAELRTALERLMPVEGLVLDLRGNGGGYFEEALRVAECFLPHGSQIVTTEGRNLPERIFFTRNHPVYPIDKGIVVLIDSLSASSSEIVAGALQDHDRAVVLGGRSFGKGLVQRPFRFADGSMLLVTVARYRTPSGRVIERPAEELLVDSLPCYPTLRTGRSVRGGGGIRPDAELPRDTTAGWHEGSEVARIVRAILSNWEVQGAAILGDPYTAM